MLESPALSLGQSPDEARARPDERDHIAREVYRATAQLLVALELQITRLKQLPVPRDARVDEVLSELESTVEELHEEVRSLGASPHGPDALVRDLKAMVDEFALRTGVLVQTDVQELPISVTPQAAHMLYRVAQEALANVSRHAQATKVVVSLRAGSRAIVLKVTDDGAGFPRPIRSVHPGRGIENMKSRLSEVGGKLRIGNRVHGAYVEAQVELCPTRHHENY
jgi:signal transduction histidine kinase